MSKPRHWLSVLLILAAILAFSETLGISSAGGDTGGVSTSTSLFVTQTQSTITTTLSTTVVKTLLVTTSSPSPTAYYVTLSDTIGLVITSQTTFLSSVTERYIMVQQSPVDTYAPPIVGGIIGALGLWIVNKWTTKSSAARKKREKRDEKVYAPLFDELPNIRKSLEEYTYPVTSEYDKIKSTHLLFIVPKKLREMILTLYEEMLPEIGRKMTEIRDTCEKAIYKDIMQSMVRPSNARSNGSTLPTSDPDAYHLAVTIGQFTMRQELPLYLATDLAQQFQAVKARSTLPQPSVEKYFKDIRGRLWAQHIEMLELKKLRDVSVNLLNRIVESLGKELEAEI